MMKLDGLNIQTADGLTVFFLRFDFKNTQPYRQPISRNNATTGWSTSTYIKSVFTISLFFYTYICLG